MNLRIWQIFISLIIVFYLGLIIDGLLHRP